MESEFDNIKEVDYYNSRNFYPSDENTTSNEHSMDPKQLLWSVNDNHNNIINEGDSKQTTTTITTTTTTSSNGQFDDNLLYSSDNLDVNQKIPSPGSDDNNLHHASTLENNGEEFLAAGYDNKNEFPAEFPVIEKTDAMQHLGEVEADYGPETCVDVTDDVVMMTENSADTNNLLEQSALSHSKDTLPSSDNCNPFDNKNTLDLEDGNDFPLGSGGGGVDVNQQLEDANKATPLLSPEVEDLPLSSEGGLQYTNEGFQHSPLDDEIPVGIGGGLHQQEVEFSHEFVESNGHLSPVDAAKEKVEQQEDIESLAKLEKFGDLDDESPLVEDGQKSDLDEDFPAEPLAVQEKENPFENVEDENDFRLKDEEELLEKHVDVSFAEQDLERLDLSHREDLHQALQNLESDVLEEKPILTGHFEPSFDDLSTEPEVEKPSEFAEEKQDREEFSEKDDREEKLTFVEQKSAPSEDIELEEEDCIHLEEDVRPSDYLAMLERQKEEHQKLSEVVEGYEGFERAEIGKLELGDHHELPTENLKYDEDDRLSDKVEQLSKEQELEQLNEQLEQSVEQLEQFEKEQLQHEADDRLDEQVEEIEKHEHYDVDENVSFGAEQREQERHLDDIEIMSQQFDRFEKEDQAEDRLNDHLLQVDDGERLRELGRSQEDIGRLCEQMEVLRHEVEELYHNKEETTQPEKQCFEEPEKLVQDDLQVVDELVLQKDEPRAESEHHDSEPEDSFEENEKQHVECTEKQLEKIEMQVLNSAAELAKSDGNDVKLFDDIPENPEELVEVVEDIIVKECVKSKLPVSSQDPAAVPPTHESCDESEDDEWKYMKEGQGEKQLLGLQGDTVVEEELQQHLESGAFSVDEKKPTSELIEQVSGVLADQIETIQESFENLTQNIAELAESAATLKDDTVNQLASNIDSLNLSQSSTREKLDNIDDEDLSASEMNSKLNPEAKEFVPTFTPPGAVDLSNGFGLPTAIPPHFKDDVLAQSPRKGRESNMELINIPAENDFDNEIALKPHGLPGDEAITEPQEMNWKESMHGYEKEEGPLIDSPVTEESLEVVDNALQGNLLDISAPVGLDNAGMKESIYIEHNTTAESGEEDMLNTVQMLPTDSDSKDTSFEAVEPANENIIDLTAENVPVDDIVSKEEVQKILTLTSDNKLDEQIEQKMEQLLLSHDNNITKDVQVPINGVEMPSTTPAEAVVIEQAEQKPTAPAAEEVLEGLSLGAAAAVAVAATTAAVKKVEAEKNQKNLNKTSSATKSKVPDAKKPISKTTSAAPLAAKRTSTEKPKLAASSTLAAKKTIGSTTSAAAPRPRTAPVAGAVKPAAEKKTTTTTTSTTARSRIDSKPPSTLLARKPLTSSAAKTTATKPGDDGKPSSATLKSASSIKSTMPAKPSTASSTRTTVTTNSIGKARPATTSSVATTNGTATKTAATKPTTLAPKSAGHMKPTLTSPRGTLTSTLRKTEAIKSPTKTTSSTITSRVNSGTTNGTKTTTTTRTTTLKPTTVPTAASRSTTTTTTTATRRTTSAVGGTTPTNKTTNLVPRKSTPLKKTTTSSSSTPTARKSIGSKLNASATKPTKDTTTPRPVTIPAHLQNNNNSIVSEEPKELVPNATSTPPAADQIVTTNGEPKLNGIASPDDVSTSPMAPTAPAHPLEVAEMA